MSFHDCLYRFESRAGPGSYEDVCCDLLKRLGHLISAGGEVLISCHACNSNMPQF